MRLALADQELVKEKECDFIVDGVLSSASAHAKNSCGKVEIIGIHRVKDMVDVVNSAQRILRRGGELKIVVPFGGSSWNDPEACREVSGSTFSVWRQGEENFRYANHPFRSVISNNDGVMLHISMRK